MESLLVLISLVAVMSIIAAITRSRRSALNDTYSRLAKHFHGHFRAPTWLDSPAATFMVDGVAVRVDVFSTGGRDSEYYTQVHLDWPDADFRLEICPVGVHGFVGQLDEMRNTTVGAVGFDANYVVRGRDPRAVRQFLSTGVQHQVDALRRFLDNDSICVSVGGGDLLVKKLSLIYDFDDLLGLVQLSLELHAQALLTRSVGIEFEDTQAYDRGELPVCPVCGAVADNEMVVCPRCQTGHHRDCWEYFGRCSTYGCGETRCHSSEPIPVFAARQGPVSNADD